MSNYPEKYYDTCVNQTIYPGKFCNARTQAQCEQWNLAVTIAPRISSLLSIFGSLIIMYRVFQIPGNKKRTYDRLLFGLATVDLCGAIIIFIGNWTVYTLVGDEITNPFCTFQAFFYQLYSATFWYNSALATNYLLRIKFEWSEYDVVKIEPYLHILGLLYPLITSFVALGMGIYGKGAAWCWIYVKYSLERWLYFYAPLWIIMFYVAICMFLIVMKVKQTEATSMRLQRHDPDLKSKTREAKIQASLYISSFLLTWIFPTANRIQNTVVPYEDFCSVFTLALLASIFVPLQGFFNFIVYIYPRMKKENRERLCKCACCAIIFGRTDTSREEKDKEEAQLETNSADKNHNHDNNADDASENNRGRVIQPEEEVIGATQVLTGSKETRPPVGTEASNETGLSKMGSIIIT